MRNRKFDRTYWINTNTIFFYFSDNSGFRDNKLFNLSIWLHHIWIKVPSRFGPKMFEKLLQLIDTKLNPFKFYLSVCYSCMARSTCRLLTCENLHIENLQAYHELSITHIMFTNRKIYNVPHSQLSSLEVCIN